MDHCLSDNLYLSKFGDEWEKELRKCNVLRSYVPVCDLIMHMAKVTTEAMKGTKYEGCGLFYHDALSQLTEKDTSEWMKKK